jgi:hypothetical protein
VLPAFDDDARFYVAPAAFMAAGGLYAVFDSDSNPEALADLARLWLLPGRQGIGIILLRSGERVEVPWQASTLLFMEDAAALPRALQEALVYTIDVSALSGATLRAFVASRLAGTPAEIEELIDALAGGMEAAGVATRQSAARAARYIRDRAAYAGEEFALTRELVASAIAFGAASFEEPTRLRRAA